MSYTIKRTDGNVAYVAKHAMLAHEAVEAAVRDKADLTGADLSRAHLSRAHLSGAHLSGAHLSGADLYGADLTGAHLYGADLTGADLTGAHLSRADLYGAHLSRAHLSGADLTGATGIIRIGPIDGWEMYAVQRSGGPRIKAGCRWFTVGEARGWWGKGGGPGNTPEHGPRMLAGVEALVALARAHEWEMPPGQEVAS
jgi:glutathione S-transferase